MIKITISLDETKSPFLDAECVPGHLCGGSPATSMEAEWMYKIRDALIEPDFLVKGQIPLVVKSPKGNC